MFVGRRSFLLSFFLRGGTGMQFSYFIITFVLQFHSAFAFPTDGWQLIDVIGAASSPGQSNGKGYECGNDFFSDSEIKEALSMFYQYMNHNLYSPTANHPAKEYSNVPQVHNIPHEYIDTGIPPGHQSFQQYFTPKIYQGPLYSDSGSLNYILWPIQKEDIAHSTSKYYSNFYYIVVRKDDGVLVDVISRIINYNFTKCIRIDSSRTELSTSAPDMNDGYQCAHDFLSDELIQASLGLFWERIGKSNLYPISYMGSLYPANSDYMIWPIFSRDKLFDYSSVEAGPYFLVIDILGNLKEIVVQGLSNNFLRCIRTRIPLKEPPLNGLPSKVPNQSLTPTSKVQFGYYCNMLFFSENAVNEAVKAAKNLNRITVYTKFPIKYDGPPFNEPLLLWPLMRNGLVFEKGSPGIHRVILTEDYQIKGVGVMQGSTIRPCDKGIKSEIKDHEKSDFICVDHIVYNRDLQNAAKNGCDSFPKGRYRFFPAKYEGPDFEKSGPYFTYPVIAGGTGPDRVVINRNCEVVGAITYFPKPNGGNRVNTFAICVKLQGRTDTKTYMLDTNPIYEHRWKYSSS